MQVLEFIREDGGNPFDVWFNSLDVQAAAKVTTAIMRLAMGNTSQVKWFDGLGEYRIHWGPGYRVYLVRDGARLIVLLGGGTKQRQQQDIQRAKELLREYKQQKARARLSASDKQSSRHKPDQT